jgi:hypothetical protein
MWLKNLWISNYWWQCEVWTFIHCWGNIHFIGMCTFSNKTECTSISLEIAHLGMWKYICRVISTEILLLLKHNGNHLKAQKLWNGLIIISSLSKLKHQVQMNKWTKSIWSNIDKHQNKPLLQKCTYGMKALSLKKQ